MKHTPGPWKLETAPGGANDGWQISSENTSCGKGRYVVIASRGPITGEEFAGNARLIAAAPELRDRLAEITRKFLRELSEWSSTGKFNPTGELLESINKGWALSSVLRGENEK